MPLIRLNDLRKGVAPGIVAVAMLCCCALLHAQNAPVELIIKKERSNVVRPIAFSPDGRMLASGMLDIELWEVSSGQLIRTLSGHSSSVRSVTFSPDGKMLASGSGDKTIKLWEASSGQLSRTFSGHSDDVNSLAFSPDGRMLVSGSTDQTIKLWETSSGQLIRTLSGHSNSVYSVAFSPDDKMLASWSGDKTIKLWEASSGRLLRTLSGLSGNISSIAFSSDGKMRASGSWSNTIKLWEASSGHLIRTLYGHPSPAYSIAFSPDGRMLASGNANKTINVWQTSSGQLIRTLSGHSHAAYSVAFSPDGRALISSDGAEGVRVWSVESGRLVATHLFLSKNNWITYTPDNYYVCSADAVSYLEWKQGNKTYDYSAFSAQFNKPDIVAARLRSLGTEPTTIAATPQSNNANITTANTEIPKPPPTPKDTTPPKIVITSPPLTRGQGVRPATDRILKQSGSSLTVTGQATDESGVREVNVRGAVVARLDEHGNFSVEVPLQVGDNPITVTATDIHGNRATESFIVRYEPPPMTGRYFALVIGNNRYPNLPAERQLKTAVNDAQEVAALLRTEYGFQTKLLTDVKRAEIINALNEYRRSLKADDNLLIYYAGHGHFDSETGKAYWIPTDAELGSPANWIIADDVTSTIRAIPSRHILIVSDSCYSGTLTRATDFRLSTPAERERYLEKMRGGTSRILMASGGNEPVADGGGGNHSVFARALLDGLRGMSERVFTADELFHQFIKERVAGKSDQTPEYNPLRNSGHESGDFVFVRVR